MQYKVWYGKSWDIDRNNLDNQAKQTFVDLMTIEADNLDDVYYKMQGEVWSPNGEARGFIRSKGLEHTSMSTGDVIEDVEAGKFYMVQFFGFKECERVA